MCIEFRNPPGPVEVSRRSSLPSPARARVRFGASRFGDKGERLKLLGQAAGLLLVPWLVGAAPTISGRILNDVTGFGIAGIDLDVFDAQGKSVTVTGGNSTADGSYVLELPGPGDYVVRADPSRTDFFVDLYYSQVFLRSQATPIRVAADSAVVGIDFRLRTGFEIRGRVLSAGVPQAGIDMDLFAEDGEFLDGYPGTTASDGSFAIGALPAGTYYLKADPDPALGQWLVDAYYQASYVRSLATPIVISTSDLSGIEITLSPGGVIQGRVIAQGSGLPLGEVDLDLFDLTGRLVPLNGTTDSNGLYTIGPAPQGGYTVRVDPTLEQGYPRTYYPGVPFHEEAGVIAVMVGLATTNIDFALARAGAISGRMVDAETGLGIDGIDLDAFAANGQRVEATARSLPDGTYLLGPLAAGEYILRADPTLAQGYARTYHPGSPFSSEAVLLTVVGDNTNSNVNFQLSRAGSVSGRVAEALTGAGLGSIDLDVFDVNGRRLDVTAKSALDGSYVLGPLPAGSVLIRADPDPTQGWQTQYFQDSAGLTNATAVTVTAGADSPNIDFHLLGAGWLAGTVWNAELQPLVGIDLDLYIAATGERVRLGDATQPDGSFLIGPLAPGAYKLRADPTLLQGYAVEYFDNKLNRDLADNIVVTAGAGATGIDFILESGGSLSGRVTARQTGQPLAGMDLDVLIVDTQTRLDQSVKTDIEGRFTLGPVAAGTYLLRADPVSGQPLLRTYFGQATDPAQAQPIPLAAGEHAVNLDIQVLPADGLVLPQLLIRLVAVDQVELTFPTQAGTPYWLEFKGSLSDAAWEVLNTGTGAGNTASVLDTLPGGASRFYRLRMP